MSLIAFGLTLAMLFITQPVSAITGASRITAGEPVFIYGASDADSVAVESGFHYNMNFFWWDHPKLTVAVRAAPNVDPLKLQAVHDAIAV